MAFGKALTDRFDAANTERKPFVSPFLQLTDQNPEVTIRILDNDITPYWRYWMNVKVGDIWTGRPVIVGKGGPIKEYMAMLDRDDPKRRSPSMRAYVNVLDRASNTVKIWDIGRDMVESLQVFDGRQISRQTGKKMSLQEFDILLVRQMRTASDGSKRANVVPSPSFNDEPLTEEQLNAPRYDLVKMVQPMPEEAQARLLAGEDYNEVRKSLGWLGEYPMINPNELPF